MPGGGGVIASYRYNNMTVNFGLLIVYHIATIQMAYLRTCYKAHLKFEGSVLGVWGYNGKF